MGTLDRPPARFDFVGWAFAADPGRSELDLVPMVCGEHAIDVPILSPVRYVRSGEDLTFEPLNRKRVVCARVRRVDNGFGPKVWERENVMSNDDWALLARSMGRCALCHGGGTIIDPGAEMHGTLRRFCTRDNCEREMCWYLGWSETDNRCGYACAVHGFPRTDRDVRLVGPLVDCHVCDGTGWNHTARRVASSRGVQGLSLFDFVDPERRAQRLASRAYQTSP